MLVVRCECEEILGVEEQHLDKLGECPACGRIIRAPKQAMNLSGKLQAQRLAAVGAKAAPPAPVETAVAVAEPEEEISILEEAPVITPGELGKRFLH